ncbi:hypothetical protein SI65_00365 [Aspergillus cristatus]|uniref:Myb-like domain-containing protein n=1 Tax=Aspergillus cristatus TaxID=573508 RepID=A0A1E3BQY9_ASPCR|nr:hypothetical protein SI65_00365 [Aspergillus cristatus]
MSIKRRRRLSSSSRWTEEERNKLWRLRQQNLEMSWEDFSDRFFPFRTKAALTKAYSDMKVQRNSNEISQNNKHKSPAGETTVKKSKTRLSSFVVSDDEESESVSLSEESDLGDSDTEDSDAGDIPYDDCLPRQILYKPPPSNPSNRNSSALSVVKAPRFTAKRTGTSRLSAAKATNPTIRPIKVQNSSNGGTAATPSATRNIRDQTLPANSNPTHGLGSKSAAGAQPISTKSTNRPAADAVPEVTDESYTLLSRSFHYAANIFAQYPQVTARVEKAEKDGADKDRLIKELQSSDEAKVSELRDRLVAQNKMMSEQVAVIEHFQRRLKTSESQAGRVQRLEFELAELKRDLHSPKLKIESLYRED